MVRKSGSTRAPLAGGPAPTNGEGLYARKQSVTDMIPPAPRGGGASMRWLLSAALCLIVVAALGRLLRRSRAALIYARV